MAAGVQERAQPAADGCCVLGILRRSIGREIEHVIILIIERERIGISFQHEVEWVDVELFDCVVAEDG